MSTNYITYSHIYKLYYVLHLLIIFNETKCVYINNSNLIYQNTIITRNDNPNLTHQNTIITWNDAKYFIETKQLSFFKRNPESLKIYRKTVSELLLLYETIEDQVLNEIFEYPYEISESSDKRYVDKDYLKIQKYIFIRNNFPYAFSNDINHHVIWSTYDLSDSQINEIIKTHLHNHESLYFINTINNKSVKGIYHVHVLSRIKEN